MYKWKSWISQVRGVWLFAHKNFCIYYGGYDIIYLIIREY